MHILQVISVFLWRICSSLTKINSMKIRVYIWAFLASLVVILSCEKDDDENTKNRFAIDKSKTYIDDEYENKLKDSVWYYYKYLSLWEPVIEPATARLNEMDSTYFLKKNYTKYFQSANDVIGYLMYLTKASVVGKSVPSNVGSGNNYNFYSDVLYTHNKDESKAYDWYSFLDRGGFVSGAIQKGLVSGLGMEVVYIDKSNDNNADLFIRFVEKNSAAYIAGLRRGFQILKLNDDSRIDYNTQKAGNFNTLNNYLNSSRVTVEYKTPAGEIHSVEVIYKSNNYADAVFVDTVLTTGGKNVGYLGLSSFLSRDAWVITSEGYQRFDNRINNAFAAFTAQGISEFVMDLRYNGGGSVLTAEYLSDLLVPSSASSQLMYNYKINTILKEFGWDEPGEEFGPVYFTKQGSLNLDRVYFLVTEETASASELLINILSPYMDVYMIGTYHSENGKTVANNTYGKPVGFFPIDVVTASNQLYVASFQMFNKDGYGDYFDGLKPKHHVWEFQSFLDFGNTEETMLATALEHIRTGVFKTTQPRSVQGKYNLESKISREGFGPRKIQGMYKFPSKKVQF